MNLVIIGSGNGLLPVQRQAITWPNAALLSTAPLGTNSSEFEIVIQKFSFIKKCLEMSSVKWWPFCPGADELIMHILMCHWLNLPCWTPWYIECDYVPGCWVLLSVHILLTKANIWNSMHWQQGPFPNVEECFCLLCGHGVYRMYAFNAYIH